MSSRVDLATFRFRGSPSWESAHPPSLKHRQRPAREWRSAAALALLAFLLATSRSAQGQSSNPIVAENALPGVPQSTWQPGGSVPTIRGFTSEVSVNKGEPITFYIQTPDAPNIVYDLVVYRLGYYQGNGAREVARFTGTSVDQPPCLSTPTPSLDPATDAKEYPFLLDCGNWIPSWTWTTPANLVSGLFLAKVQRRDTRISCGIFFVIRDDARSSDILLQTSDTTWQAYNYGAVYQGGSIPPERASDGHSVYDALNRRAYKVSTRRPHLGVVTNSVPPFDQVVQENTVSQVFRYGEEYPTIRFLEANGFDVAYTTGKDSDQRGELIRNHRLFMTSGHDEYWSLRQMQNVTAARDAGVNLAFFSGNSAYWKIRWEDNYHTMVVFKERKGPKLDPLPGVSTGLFRDPDFGPPSYDGYQPENGLGGLLTSIPIHIDYPLNVPEPDGKLRFWRNTPIASLAPGQVAVFDDLLGYEIDGDVDNGFRPPGLFHVTTTEVVNQESSSFELGRSAVFHHMSLYRAASGALVFHAGTMRVFRALAGFYNLARIPEDPRLQQAIVNLFADMNVQPANLQSGLSLAVRSSDFTPPTAAVTLPRSGSSVKALDTVFVSGSAADSGGRVAAVEVSTDRGATWHPATGRESWQYSFTPCSPGNYDIVARAIDDSGNIGASSAVIPITAVSATTSDFVVNGMFECGFDLIPALPGTNRLGRGWSYRAESGRTLLLTQGGQIPGVSLQRVNATGNRDGIGQDLTLMPGREYSLAARIFVESGRVLLRIGQRGQAQDVQVPITVTGRWQSVSASYSPSQAACTFLITSDAGPALFKVDDVSLSTQASSPVNNPPTISGIGPQTISEDGTAGPIPFTLADPDTSLGNLALSAITSNPGLIPIGNITFGGSGANRTVTLRPLANQSGTAQVTIAVADGNGGTDSTVFTLTVNAVNDPPTTTTIGPQTANEGQTIGPIPFTVADIDTPLNTLTLTAKTTNAGLLPVGNIVFGGSGANRTVTLKPLDNQSGTAQITITVSDGGGQADSTSFTVSVSQVDDPPTISNIGPQTTLEDTSLGPIAFTVADVDTPANTLTLSATTSNAGLLPVGNIAFGGGGGNRTVTLKPVSNQSGTAQVTITVSDAAGATDSTTFTLTVRAVNDLPIITTIGNQTLNEDGVSGPIPFTVSDVDTPLNTLVLAATTSNATLLPVANITFAGTGANRTVTLRPAANQWGAAQVTITVADESGETDFTRFTVTVKPVNDAPTLTDIGAQTIDEDGSTGPITFTVSDIDNPANTLTLAGSSSNEELVPLENIVFGGTGATRTVTVSPVANLSGTAQVTITVLDGSGGSASTSFPVTVNAVNDAPTLTAIAAQTVEEGGTVGPLPLTVSDIDNPISSLILSGGATNTELVPAANIVFGGSGSNRTVTLIPAAKKSGVASITISVLDPGGASAKTTFTLTVKEPINPPTITGIGAQTINEDGSAGPIPFTIADIGTPANLLTLTAKTTNPGLLPTSNIVFGGSGSNRTVTLTPVANQSGATQVTLTVSDEGGGSADTSFNFTVNPVNDPPAITSIEAQSMNEDGTLGPIPFTVTDIDSPVPSLTLSAKSTNGILVPEGNIVFGGSGTSRSVTLRSAANLSGTSQITVTVTDGSGATASTSFSVTVNPVDDPPTITDIGPQLVDKDGTIGPIAFTIGDVDTPLNGLTLKAASSNTRLVPVENIVFQGNGANRTVTVKPVADQPGSAQVTITLSDGVARSSNPSFTVSVEPLRSIAEENALPGVPQSTWQPGGSVPTIRGFTSEVSVNRGEPLTFYIQTPDGANVTYDLVVYRLGYYRGDGAREVARFTGTSVDQPQCLSSPTPSLDPATDAKQFPRLIDCGNWNPSWTWSTPANLMSGLFLAKVQRRDTRISCGIFFVIRDDARKSDILLQTSDTTWQAYNYGPAYQGGSIPPGRAMDGHSLYEFLNGRAYKVSYRRPHLSVVTNTAPPYNQVVLENTVGQVLRYGEEYPMIRFLEANGYDVSYTTGKDSDQRGELIRNHRLFISSGHDEYWSLQQRRHVEAARDAGVNLAFFSGNTAYWRIRWEDDYHTMVVFKEHKSPKLDPLPGVTTSLFRDPDFGPPAYDGYLPENALGGLLTSQTTQIDQGLRVPESDGKLRFWRNTSVATLAPGQVATFNDNLVGYELDGDVDNGFRPAGLFHLSTTEMQDLASSNLELGRTALTHHLSLYRAASGALVFHAGTMRLQRALAGYYNLTPATGDPRLQQAIVNLFADMNVQPETLQAGLALATRSTDTIPPTARVAAPRTGSCVKVLDTALLSGTAEDRGGRVAAVEISTDGGTSWHPAIGREAWRYAFTPCEAGLYQVYARAVDDSGNIGAPSSLCLINASAMSTNDFVINGLFDCGFDTLPGGGEALQIGRGWFRHSTSGRALSLTLGGQVPGINLQRVVAAGAGDGMGQQLILAPGRAYNLAARVFVESGRAALKIGRRDAVNELIVPTTATGRWETLTATYSPQQSACTLLVTSDGDAAVFKVDDVTLTANSDGVGPAVSLSRQANGFFQIELVGQPGFTCCVQTSTNLLDWDFLFLGNSTTGHLLYPDLQIPLNPLRFYRAEAP